EACAIGDRQVRSMTSIIDDLIDIFRITYHEVELRKEPLDLVELVRQVVEDERSPLETNRLTVTLQVPNAPVWILGDRLRLCQVMVHLLHNAAKFTHAGDRVFVRL